MSRPMSVRPSVEMVSCSACTPPATTIVVFGCGGVDGHLDRLAGVDDHGPSMCARRAVRRRHRALRCSARPRRRGLAGCGWTGGGGFDAWCAPGRRRRWSPPPPGSAAWGRRCPESRSVPSAWVTAHSPWAHRAASRLRSGCVRHARADLPGRTVGPVDVAVLGPLVIGDGRLVLGSRKERAVVELLALRVPHGASVDALVGAVWGERPPRSATKTLQSLVSRARSAAPGLVIDRVGDAYRLAVDRVDAEEFEHLVVDGTAGVGRRRRRGRRSRR